METELRRDSLMILPPEIRRKIFKYLLSDADDDDDDDVVRLYSSQLRQEPIEPSASFDALEPDWHADPIKIYGASDPVDINIIYASRQLHNEAIPFLYGHNFQFGDWLEVGQWLHTIESNKNLVKSIILCECIVEPFIQDSYMMHLLEYTFFLLSEATLLNSICIGNIGSDLIEATKCECSSWLEVAIPFILKWGQKGGDPLSGVNVFCFMTTFHFKGIKQLAEQATANDGGEGSNQLSFETPTNPELAVTSDFLRKVLELYLVPRTAKEDL